MILPKPLVKDRNINCIAFNTFDKGSIRQGLIGLATKSGSVIFTSF